MLLRVGFFTHSTVTNSNLFEKHPHRQPPAPSYLASLSSVKLTNKINHRKVFLMNSSKSLCVNNLSKGVDDSGHQR